MKKRNRFISLVLTLGLALSVMATSVSASKFVDAHGNEVELDDTLEAYSSVIFVFRSPIIQATCQKIGTFGYIF